MAHRFFIPPECITPPTVQLPPETARQVRTVLRMQAGDEIIVLDDTGLERTVRLTQVSKEQVRGEITGRRRSPGEPAVEVLLYQATLKGQKFELVLEKGTELGVSRFTPVICQRSVVRDAAAVEKKYDRWQRIIREAAEVCGRGRLPRLERVMSLETALRHAVYAPVRLMFWEAGGEVSLKTVLQTERPRRIAVFIGPEGGFAPEEVALARQTGCQVVGMGRRILRAETAGAVAVAAIFYELDEWGVPAGESSPR
ncbi:MAG: 16S rRNA (uracil(1498)-N(3))-methyltransferase [Chloroflexi bacterium]|nr:MAG: 16S rRNA (uracil(1498)-N(3))-methyltransferase [Chloroflexota bacterium]